MRIKKSEIITLRVTPRIKETIRERAKAAGLQAHRTANDEICAAHGLEILPPLRKQVKQKQMSAREFRSAVKGESWKFRLMNTIDQCMRYATTREGVISLMESEGYQVH